MSRKPSAPADSFDVLKRLMNANWNEVAKALGVSTKTLRAWRAGEGGKNAAEKQQLLFEALLRNANADWLTMRTNWTNIATIGGRR